MRRVIGPGFNLLEWRVDHLCLPVADFPIAAGDCGDCLFDRIAKRMPHQNVAFLNARRFVRWRGDQHIDESAHAPTGSAGKPDGIDTHLARDRDGFHDALRIS